MSDSQYVKEVFHHLHRIPEKQLQEFQTSKFIAQELKKFGFHVEEGVGETGVIGRLDSGKEGTVLGMRADMDSLPFIIDDQPVDIHACGHDAHSAMVLAAAKNVAEKGISRGKAVFIFQPAEETLKGAQLMVDTGKLSDLEELVGIHLRPIHDTRLGEASPAVYHTACHRIRVKIKGVPAHSARLHLGVNTIEAAMLIINAVNAVRADPNVSHSVKATRINTPGLADNIIPPRTDIIFDFRAESDDVMEELKQKAETAISNGAQALGASTEIEFISSAPAAVYDERMVQFVGETIEELFGNTLEPAVTAGSEDFHIFTRALNLKSAYIGLGADLTPGLHHPEMTFDTKALGLGQELLQRIVFKKLASENEL
ncbi:MAG: amidohydrolase [SAR324 cluster bacterium]|nr:amidohydrolase [SAR324 cluster bacterium]